MIQGEIQFEAAEKATDHRPLNDEQRAILHQWFPLVCKIARTFAGMHDLDRQEVESEAMLHATRAMRTFNPNKSKFGTYVGNSVTRALKAWMGNRHRRAGFTGKKFAPVRADFDFSIVAAKPVEFYEGPEVASVEWLAELISDDVNRWIFVERYGNHRTPEEIAVARGQTRQNIDRRLQEVRRELHTKLKGTRLEAATNGKFRRATTKNVSTTEVGS